MATEDTTMDRQLGHVSSETNDMTPIRPLFPHQKDALNWVKTRSLGGHYGGVALFMEMRLGKTKVVIELLKPPLYSRILVVAPLTVLTAWQNELKAEQQNYFMLMGTKHQRMLHWDLTKNMAGWFLINYEGLLSCENLAFKPWDAVVVDESTRIKNPKAMITRLLNHKDAFPQNKTRIILSGKPAPESPMDYFEQFRFISKHFMKFNNFWHFRDTCFFQIPNRYEWLPKPQWKHTIKDYVQKNSFILSRKQTNMGNKKFYEVRTVPM